MNPTAPSGGNGTGEILREVNQKLLIASVHQQELAEMAMQAQQRLSALIHGLSAVICEIRLPAGDITFVSDHAESLLGYPRAMWQTRGFWRRVIHPDDRAAALAHFLDAIRSHRDYEQEFRAVAENGTILWMRNRAVIVYGDDGKASLLRCVIVDVSASREAERIISQSEQRYRRLFETARDGILLLDIDSGAITDANPFACELLGFSDQEIRGKSLFDVGLFADEEESQIALTRLQTRKDLHVESLPLRTALQPIRMVELVGSVYGENGKSVIKCNIRDITDRMRVEVLHAEMLQREQRITEILQRPLLTHFKTDTFPGMSIATLYEPALGEAEVGGDFYDAFTVNPFSPTESNDSVAPSRVLVCVGDVMGKGLAAAALAARLREVLHAFTDESDAPEQTMYRLNNYLCRINAEDTTKPLSLCALSLAIIDTVASTATVAMAGSEPVFVIRKDGPVEVMTMTGMMLGIQRNETFRSVQIALPPGDTLILLTDGLTEVRKGRNFLGYERLTEIAREHDHLSSLFDMGAAIVDTARAFGGRFTDDVCLLLVRCRN